MLEGLRKLQTNRSKAIDVEGMIAVALTIQKRKGAGMPLRPRMPGCYSLSAPKTLNAPCFEEALRVDQ